MFGFHGTRIAALEAQVEVLQEQVYQLERKRLEDNTIWAPTQLDYAPLDPYSITVSDYHSGKPAPVVGVVKDILRHLGLRVVTKLGQPETTVVEKDPNLVTCTVDIKPEKKKK